MVVTPISASYSSIVVLVKEDVEIGVKIKHLYTDNMEKII